MKNALFILLIATLYFGCKKANNNDLEKAHALENGSYRSALRSEPSQIIMYTKAGVITDYEFIKNYIYKKGKINFFNYSFAGVPIGNGFLTMIVNGSNDIVINVAPELGLPDTWYLPGFEEKPFTISGSIVNKSPSDFLVQSKKADSSWTSYQPDTTSNDTRKYREFYKYIPPFAGTSYPGRLISWSRLTFATSSNDFYFPIMRNLIYAKDKYGSTSFSSYNSYAVLNPNLRDKMNVGDTIVVQTELIKMIKQ